MFAVIFNFILYISNKLFFRTSRSPDGLSSRLRRDRRGESEETQLSILIELKISLKIFNKERNGYPTNIEVNPLDVAKTYLHILPSKLYRSACCQICHPVKTSANCFCFRL